MSVVTALVLGALVGAFIPVQTAINAQLSGRLGAVLPASLVSFTVGTVGLGLAVALTGAPLPLAETAADQPWWVWTGGVCGLVFLTMNIVLLPRIGAAATVVLPLVGQVLGGLVVDLFGAFDTAVRPLTPLRALGGVLVIAGAVVVNVAGRPPHPPGHARPHPLLWVVAVLTGTLGAVQTAVNGRLGQVLGSGLSAALVSFAVGMVGLLLVNLLSRQRVRRSGQLRPWLFSGGLLGAAFVLVNALNAPVLGTSLAVSIVLLGQIAAGLAMDHSGHLGVARRPVTALRILGALVVLAGVAFVRFG